MIYVPKISPIRFTRITTGNNKAQDLGGLFNEVDYVNYCNEFPVGHTIKFQVYSDTALADVGISVNGVQISVNDITPSGWSGVGTYVFEASYTIPNDDGFYFYIDEDGTNYFESGSIKPTTDEDNLLRIDYKNSDSDYGYINNNDSYLTVWLTADYRELVLKNDIVGYENDRGELTKLKATPTENYTLNVEMSPYYIGNMLNMIFSCDDILINSQPFQTNESVEAELIETSNLFNYSVNIQRTDDNYMFF